MEKSTAFLILLSQWFYQHYNSRPLDLLLCEIINVLIAEVVLSWALCYIWKYPVYYIIYYFEKLAALTDSQDLTGLTQ